jgi:hypothetical protein
MLSPLPDPCKKIVAKSQTRDAPRAGSDNFLEMYTDEVRDFAHHLKPAEDGVVLCLFGLDSPETGPGLSYLLQRGMDN